MAWTYPSILNMTKNPDLVQLPYIFWQSIRDKKETSAEMIKSRRCFNLDYSSGAYGIAEKLSARQTSGINTYTKGAYAGCIAYSYYTRELKKI